jgi:hypothetical protein
MKQHIRPTTSLHFAFVLIALLTLATGAFGQRTRVKTTESIPSSQTNEVKKAEESVAIQIKNVSKFVFVLGGVARGIEDIDKEIKAGRASQELRTQNQQFKDDVLSSVRALRAGLVKLEVDFRAKPALRKYLPQIQGISDQSATAEDLAYSGQLVACGKELLLIVEKLVDTLVAMP